MPNSGSLLLHNLEFLLPKFLFKFSVQIHTFIQKIFWSISDKFNLQKFLSSFMLHVCSEVCVLTFCGRPCWGSGGRSRDVPPRCLRTDAGRDAGCGTPPPTWTPEGFPAACASPSQTPPSNLRIKQQVRVHSHRTEAKLNFDLCFKAHSHRPKAKIFFCVSIVFFDLFRLFFDLFRFCFHFRLV